MEVEIEIAERSAKNKGEVNKLRRDGNIPCVIYSAGTPSKSTESTVSPCKSRRISGIESTLND